MAKRFSAWHVKRRVDPPQYAFFISHVTENSRSVRRLKREIATISGRGGKRTLDCFLDTHNWPIANEVSEAIKDGILKSEYMVIWVTPEYLKKNRGWVWVELAYAELLELSQTGPSIQFPYIVPVFRDVGVGGILRTPLLKYWPRALPPGRRSVAKIARSLVDFYEQEAEKRSVS